MGKIEYKAEENVTKTQKWSAFCHFRMVFEYTYSVSCSFQDLEAPRASDMIIVLDVIRKNSNFFMFNVCPASHNDFRTCRTWSVCLSETCEDKTISSKNTIANWHRLQPVGRPFLVETSLARSSIWRAFKYNGTDRNETWRWSYLELVWQSLPANICSLPPIPKISLYHRGSLYICPSTVLGKTFGSLVC